MDGLLVLAQTAQGADQTAFNVFVVGALSALGGFTAKLVLDQINDLRKRLDAANARTEAAVETGHQVTTTLQELVATVDKLVDTVGREHHPPDGKT